MKKIIFFARDLSIGGIEKSLVNLLNSLVDSYDTTLVLEKNEGPLKKDLSKKVKIIEHKLSSLKLTPIRKAINYTRRLIFTKKHKDKYDFSCAYTSYLYSSVKLSLICSKNSAIYIHSNYRNLYKKKEFMEFFDTRFIKDFKKIIFVSNESKKGFLEYYPNLKDKALVINNIVNIKEILEKSKEKINLKKGKNDIVFSFVGRLDEESKKISRLLECFKILTTKNKNIKLWIIGNGEEYQKSKDFIKENNLGKNIILLGSKKNPYKYMKASDYIILTSNYEGFPVVFNEANILNKVVFSTLNITDDYYKLSKGSGFVIPKEINLMAKNIEQIIKTKPTAKKIDYKKLNKERLTKIHKLIENEE